MDVRPSFPLSPDQEAAFFQVVRAGFAQSRKQLRNSLAHGLGLPPQGIAEALDQLGIDPRQRAQELSLSEWISVYRALA
jgi:16S rRNA (adenine1518-N6/adenine1519-N6)-dimethyltransferase